MKLKISFGIIVLNGEPFTKYCLRQLYPFAHQIIVSEGAVEGAETISTKEGHSIDGTLETLAKLKHEEDPENKIIIIEHDGFWFDKNEQSKAYAKIATGDYLWQVDIDEFYKNEDIEKIFNLLAENRDITAISFPTLTFWGSPCYRCDSWMLIRQNYYEVFRIFRWNEMYEYKTHIPPTVIDERGRNLREMNSINGEFLRKRGIWMYHYSLLFPVQVRLKGEYYSLRKNRPQVDGWVDWMENSYLTLKRPFRTHNTFRYPGWLERFEGTHPEQIESMWNDILNKLIDVEVRQTEDIEKLLNTWWYPTGRVLLKLIEPLDRFCRKLIWNRVTGNVKKVLMKALLFRRKH